MMRLYEINAARKQIRKRRALARIANRVGMASVGVAFLMFAGAASFADEPAGTVYPVSGWTMLALAAGALLLFGIGVISTIASEKAIKRLTRLDKQLGRMKKQAYPPFIRTGARRRNTA